MIDEDRSRRPHKPGEETEPPGAEGEPDYGHARDWVIGWALFAFVVFFLGMLVEFFSKR